MDDALPFEEVVEPAARPSAPTRLPLPTWLREGLRAGVFRRPRVADAAPTPPQLAAILAILVLVELALARFEVIGPANFDLRAWLAPWWSTGAILLIAWWALPRRLAAWFTLWIVALFPANFVSQLLGIAQAHQALPAWLSESDAASWGLYLALWAWTLAVTLKLSAHLGVGRKRLSTLGVAMVGIFWLGAWQFPDRPWEANAAAATRRPYLELSQETFEAQQSLWQKAVQGLAAERPGVTDVYGLVFAPYAREDVFMRESTMVAQLLAERFDAGGRVLHLLNHPETGETHLWATPANLERAVEALAARMDRDNDVLVVYLTSHGAKDFRLAATNYPLKVEPVSPGELRQALDKAGIRHRVITVSACYAGGWVGPLASDTSLVMTAADDTHTSYGCGRLSELTYFGRAVFDEQLRKTHSFEQAFAQAVPVIRQREIDAGKSDGFSNPQISVGEKIRPVLQALEQRLATAAAK